MPIEVPATIVMRAAESTPKCGVSSCTRTPPSSAANGMTPHVMVRNAACDTAWSAGSTRACRMAAVLTLYQTMNRP